MCLTCRVCSDQATSIPERMGCNLQLLYEYYTAICTKAYIRISTGLDAAGRVEGFSMD